MTTPRSRLSACLVLLTLVLAPASAWAAPKQGDGEEQQLYKRLLRSTVLIIAFDGPLPRTGRFQHHQATGWVVDVKKRLVVTNFHVVRGNDHFIAAFPTFINGQLAVERGAYVTEVMRGNGIEATVVTKNEKRDLAVIKLQRLPRGVLALPLARKDPRPGQTVYSIGNPGSQHRLWRFFSQKVADVGPRRIESTSLSGKDPIHIEARVIRVKLPQAQGRGPGESGGPLVNAEGELVGVTQGGDLKSTPPAVTFIDAAEVKALLKANDLLPKPEPQHVAHRKPKPAPEAAAPRAEEPPPDVEAEVQLRLAKQLADAGRVEPAKERLSGLIRKYPKTEAAREAQKLLAKIQQ